MGGADCSKEAINRGTGIVRANAVFCVCGGERWDEGN